MDKAIDNKTPNIIAKDLPRLLNCVPSIFLSVAINKAREIDMPIIVIVIAVISISSFNFNLDAKNSNTPIIVPIRTKTLERIPSDLYASFAGILLIRYKQPVRVPTRILNEINASFIAFHFKRFANASKLPLNESNIPTVLLRSLNVLNNIATDNIFFANSVIVGISIVFVPSTNSVIACKTSLNFLNPALIVSPYLR